MAGVPAPASSRAWTRGRWTRIVVVVSDGVTGGRATAGRPAERSSGATRGSSRRTISSVRPRRYAPRAFPRRRSPGPGRSGVAIPREPPSGRRDPDRRAGRPVRSSWPGPGRRGSRKASGRGPRPVEAGPSGGSAVSARNPSRAAPRPRGHRGRAFGRCSRLPFPGSTRAGIVAPALPARGSSGPESGRNLVQSGNSGNPNRPGKGNQSTAWRSAQDQRSDRVPPDWAWRTWRNAFSFAAM